MRIGFNFHTTDEFISGVEHYSLGLLTALLELDRENEYIVFTNQPGLVRGSVQGKPNLKIKGIKLESRYKRILWEHFRLPRIAKEERLDILHCPHYICPAFSAGVPYVVTMHDTIAIDYPKLCKITNAAYFGFFMKRTAAKASSIISVSKSTARNIQRNFQTGGSKVRVIYPGIESIFNGHKDAFRERDIRSKYHLNEKYILFVGNIEPKKNIRNLLKAFELLKKNGLSHKLVLAGKRTWKSKDIWNFIRSGPFAKDIIVTGYIDRKDLPFVYRMADVVCLVSLCEGFGFPALEAMACGAPVVASRTGILEEIEEKAYCYADSDLPEKIAEAIYFLTANRNERARQIRLAQKEVSRFDWHSCACDTLSVYREAVEDYRQKNKTA